MAPLGKVAGARTTWAVHTALYTLAGAISSVLAGVLLAVFGGWLVPERMRTAAIAGLLAVAGLAVARELGWLRIPLPQPRRQTNGFWGHRFGAATTATLWGLDLGLTVTARFTFAGTWVLVLFPIVTGQVLLSGAALLAFWLARALPTWTAPLLMADANAGLGLLDAVNAQKRVFRLANALGSAVLMVFLAMSIS